MKPATEVIAYNPMQVITLFIKESLINYLLKKTLTVVKDSNLPFSLAIFPKTYHNDKTH